MMRQYRLEPKFSWFVAHMIHLRVEQRVRHMAWKVPAWRGSWMTIRKNTDKHGWFHL